MHIPSGQKRRGSLRRPSPLVTIAYTICYIALLGFAGLVAATDSPGGVVARHVATIGPIARLVSLGSQAGPVIYMLVGGGLVGMVCLWSDLLSRRKAFQGSQLVKIETKHHSGDRQ
jgi:hypothetical protein